MGAQPPDQQEQLRQAIDRQRDRLRGLVPADREEAILALLRARDRLPRQATLPPAFDLASGRQLADPGGNLALRLCLEATGDGLLVGDLDRWAEGFLSECAALAQAETVLGHCETGFMRLAARGDAFNAWLATRRPPAGWRERADFDWWAASLARQHPVGALESGGDPRNEPAYRKLASALIDSMGYQLGYPPDAVVGGCAIKTYRDVLAQLIVRALLARDRGEEAGYQSERALVTSLAAALRLDHAVAARALAAFTIDRESAVWHSAVPGIAAAPLARVDDDRLVWSIYGLTTEPLLFLTRELRRRDAQDYNTTAHVREGVFRSDLYALFSDRRFVTSAGRIELRRESGTVRTDIDAVAFDRKTGSLAFFELKSQDPFARSPAELGRQRDNLLYANRQVSGALAWLQRYGANELLKRVDSRVAKTFRAHRVYPFVLGRYLARFGDGPEPDRRAAWGTWPQTLRLLDGQPARAGDSNPIASLHSRLLKDDPDLTPPPDTPALVIELGAARLTVHPSYAALQASPSSRQAGD